AVPCVALLAPQASGGIWYPQRFFAPVEQNEPCLTSAMEVIAGLMREIEAAGVAPAKTLVAGFSQGACLALEYSARNARRYGGVVGLSGALIGPPGTPRDRKGDMARTPVYLGYGDRDAH